MKPHFGCPVQGTVNVIGGKWKVLIIWHLGFEPRGFAQLRNLMPGVSEKMLAAQLRQMRADGIVVRHEAETVPPQVTYSLSPAGEELLEPMNLLCGWGTRHLGIPPNLPRYPRKQSPLADP
jgi:DNA-binding HxlR family transcriptional regulator